MNAVLLMEGVIHSYDPERREIRVALADTENSDLHPVADIMYPYGAKPSDTEIFVEVGDLVWCTFLNGDENYPLIVGYRCPHTGNLQDIRRIRQKNIELLAVQQLKGTAETILYTATSKATIEAPAIELKGEVKITGNAQTTGNMKVGTGATGIVPTISGLVLTIQDGIVIQIA